MNFLDILIPHGELPPSDDTDSKLLMSQTVVKKQASFYASQFVLDCFQKFCPHE